MNFTDYLKLDADFRQAMDVYSKEYHFGGIEGDIEGGYLLAQKYLDAMKAKAENDQSFCELAGSYLRGEGKTLLLIDVLSEVQIYCDDKVLNQHNGLAYIDSASYKFDREQKTCCDVEMK